MYCSCVRRCLRATTTSHDGRLQEPARLPAVSAAAYSLQQRAASFSYTGLAERKYDEGAAARRLTNLGTLDEEEEEEDARGPLGHVLDEQAVPGARSRLVVEA